MRLYHIALSHMKRRKGKLFFLSLGLFIGISTIVSLLTITEGMIRDIEEHLDQFGANIVMIPRSEHLPLSYGGIIVGNMTFQSRDLDESKLPEIKNIENGKNVGIVAPKVIGPVTVKEKQVLVIGIDFSAELALKNWWQIDGSAPSKGDELLVGIDAAHVLGLSAGDRINIKGREFNVAALLKRTGASEDAAVMGDLHEIQKILGKEKKISMVEIAAFCRGCPISEIALQIAEKFPDARVTTLEHLVKAKMQSIEMFRSFSYGVTSLVIVIGSLLVFVTMMGSVNERTREIGIFRAIGFRQEHIMQIFLTEALAVGLMAGLLGFLGGSIIAWFVIPFVLKGGASPGPLLSLGGVAVLLGVSLSLLASIYPARKASRLDPSAALRAL